MQNRRGYQRESASRLDCTPFSRTRSDNDCQDQEVKLLKKLTEYLLKENYTLSDITVVCLYYEQVMSLRNELIFDETLKQIEISTLDNYKGKENKIIFFYSYYNNGKMDVYVIYGEDMLCIVLSHACEMMYIMGDIYNLGIEDTTWKNMRKGLKDNSCVKKMFYDFHDNRIEIKHNLKCEHIAYLSYLTKVDSFLCPVLVEKSLPNCNHTVKIPCYASINEYKCIHNCRFRLECGHACSQKCHEKLDPEHLEYKCNKECLKMCINQHPCKKQCYEQCTDCPVIVEKWSSCGHKLKVKCSDEATPLNCNSNCSKILSCGHLCSEFCKDPCTTKCVVMQMLKKPGLCGHLFPVPCYLHTNYNQNLCYCKFLCNDILACGHVCQGNCFDCYQGRFHVPCKELCCNTLVCGHKCEIPCDKECRPCSKPCELECHHSKCSKKCGELCIPCQEMCGWECEHKRCTKRCFELCDIEPCIIPCKKLLACNHPCIGFCGDPCPSLCRFCHKDQLTEIFFGTEDKRYARFILLPDCGHILESSGFLKWIRDFSSQNGVQIICCPKCKKPISTCMRVMNHIKKNLYDFMEVKRKIFFNGIEKNVEVKWSMCIDNIVRIQRDPVFKKFPEISNFIQQLQVNGSKIKNSKKQTLNFNEVDSFKAILNLFIDIVKILRQFSKSIDQAKASYLYEGKLKEIISFLPTELKISNQTIQDIQLEIRRLNLLILLCNLSGGNILKWSKHNAIASEDLSMLFNFIHGFYRFSKTKEIKSLRILRSSNMDHFKLQRIVKAVRLKKGHWFKCPNGHYYVIGECGGAVQQSKCIECKATIGGTRHRLANHNAFAPEIDGAETPAYTRKK